MNFLDFAIATAQTTGKKLMDIFGTTPPLTRGTPKEVKSACDRLADETIKAAIEKHYPDHSYLTEETGLVDKKSDFLWIVDPLDGTGNFVNSNPFFAVSIALWKNQKPVLGVIEAPALRERFIAETNCGAFHIHGDQKEAARVSETSDLGKSYLVFCEGGVSKKDKVLKTIDTFYTKTKDMRKLGSAALELAWVGVGRADAYITHDISIWDIAAGTVFVAEAGGGIYDFEGKKWHWEKLLETKKINLVATNNKLNITLTP